VIGVDQKTDLALIKADANKPFAYVNFGESAPRVGDFVVAVGNPFGLGGTVTAGIISARGRDIGAGPYDDYIQIDAPNNKGNSGGPTFNSNGDVIGVNTAIYSPSGGSIGIGFDIPAETAKMVVAQLKDHGYVTRGWLGVQVQKVTPEIADSLGMKQAHGAIVDQPEPDSPAAKAGIQPGDVITAVNGNSLQDSRELARKIAAIAPGTTVTLDVLHQGDNRKVEVKIAEMTHRRMAKDNHDAKGERGAPYMGLQVAPTRHAGAPKDEGLVVTGVDPDGPAAEHGIKTGDVILSVGGNKVANRADIIDALTKAREQGHKNVLMQVKSADVTRFIAMPIG
jgi:serine protease Do